MFLSFPGLLNNSTDRHAGPPSRYPSRSGRKCVSNQGLYYILLLYWLNFNISNYHTKKTSDFKVVNEYVTFCLAIELHTSKSSLSMISLHGNRSLMLNWNSILMQRLWTICVLVIRHNYRAYQWLIISAFTFNVWLVLPHCSSQVAGKNGTCPNVAKCDV